MNSEQIFQYVRMLEAGDIPNLNESDRNFLGKVFLQHGCVHYAQQLDKSLDISKNRKRTKSIYKSAQKIFTRINEMQIPYAVLKGIILSDLAYNDLYLRNSRDIDLLISPNSLKEFSEILTSAGCCQGYLKNNKVEPFSREQRVFYLTNTHQAPPFFYSVNNGMQYVEFDINLQLT